jgi:hypothetical protein
MRLVRCGSLLHFKGGRTGRLASRLADANPTPPKKRQALPLLNAAAAHGLAKALARLNAALESLRLALRSGQALDGPAPSVLSSSAPVGSASNGSAKPPAADALAADALAADAAAGAPRVAGALLRLGLWAALAAGPAVASAAATAVMAAAARANYPGGAKGLARVPPIR